MVKAFWAWNSSVCCYDFLDYQHKLIKVEIFVIHVNNNMNDLALCCVGSACRK